MSKKRPPTSPNENMNKKQAATYNPFETAKEKVVKVEFLTINGKPFFGQISEDELIFLWVKVFNKDRDLLFGAISTKSLTRNVRATFKLTTPIKLQDEFPSEHFSYENFLEDGKTERVTGRILGYVAVAEIGKKTQITVKTNFGVEPPGIVNWLQLYGVVSSTYNFRRNPDNGLYSDIFETEITLTKHVPEFLPMYGQKTTVNYPGIERVCNRCYNSGHLKRDCKNSPREWIRFIIDLVEEEKVPINYIGSWEKAVDKYLKKSQDEETDA